jgi:hypothetical protein
MANVKRITRIISRRFAVCFLIINGIFRTNHFREDEIDIRVGLYFRRDRCDRHEFARCVSEYLIMDVASCCWTTGSDTTSGCWVVRRITGNDPGL